MGHASRPVVSRRADLAWVLLFEQKNHVFHEEQGK
jgi:hypothetical protein